MSFKRGKTNFNKSILQALEVTDDTPANSNGGAVWLPHGGLSVGDNIYVKNGFTDDNLIGNIPIADPDNTGLSSQFSATSLIGAHNEYINWSWSQNGSILKPFTLTIESDGTTITASLEGENDELHLKFSDGKTLIDTTTPVTCEVTEGTDTVPVETYLYFLASDPTILVCNSNWPSDSEHCKIARCVARSASTVQTDGLLKQHNYTDAQSGGDSTGHVQHISEWIRKQPATWISGVTPTFTGSGTGSIAIGTGAGVINQLHEHTFDAITSPASIWVVNDSVAPYKKITDLNEILTNSLGGGMTNKWYTLVLWGCASQKNSGHSKLFINLPSGSYNTESSAVSDNNEYGDFSIPTIFQGCGFTIHRIILKNQSNSTFTMSISSASLLGQTVGVSAGTAPPSTDFSDSVFRISDNSDDTKKIAFEASLMTTGNIRTIYAPDRDINFDTLTLDTGIDSASPGALNIGPNAATSINIGDTNVSTNILGDLNVNTDTLKIDSVNDVAYFGRTSLLSTGAWAKFMIHGPDASSVGPHFTCTTDSDDHPLFQIQAYQHDAINFSFDGYYNGSWKSSTPTGNFSINKGSGELRFWAGGGYAAGATWNRIKAARITTSGQFSCETATDSSDTTTGSCVVKGGIGVAKKAYIGTDLHTGGISTHNNYILRCHKNTTQAITTVTATAIHTFATPDLNRTGFTLATSGAPYFYVPRDGHYICTADISFNATGGSQRECWWELGGVATTNIRYGYQNNYIGGSSVHRGTTTAIIYLETTTKLYLGVFHNQGGSINSPATTNDIDRIDVQIAYWGE